jgi:regulation of enolase protein 1 (concanavalin A-like superfamily)
MKRVVSVIMLILVVTSISTLTFNIQPVQSKANVPFSDNFSYKVLNPRWNVIDPDGGSTFSLTAHRGWLRITTTSPPGRDLLGTIKVNAPRILQTVSSDFVIETKISSIMNENDEGAGLLVWKDSANYLRLDRMSRTIGGPVQQQIFFCGTIGGNIPIPGETKIVLQSNVNPTYLRLVRRGNVFSGYYSSNGISWHHVADVTFAAKNPVRTGIDIIIEYHSGTFFADFDYFRIAVKR